MANLHSNVLNQIADRKIRFSEIVRVVRRYGIQVALVSILGAISAGIWAHFQPRLYDATALVHLDQHSSISLGAISAVGDQYDIKINTQITGLESPAVVTATINKLNLAVNPLFNPTLNTDMHDPIVREKMIKRFLKALTISRVPETELISVTFRSRNPVLSTIVANTLVDIYFSESSYLLDATRYDRLWFHQFCERNWLQLNGLLRQSIEQFAA